MLTCKNCGNESVQPEDNFCTACTRPILPKVRPGGTIWTVSLDEAVCFHWLAQCERRLTFPIESTEEMPYVAFEYGWKVINRFYNELELSESTDPKAGKKQSLPVKKSFLHLLEKLEVIDKVIDENRDLIAKLCDCVLETPDSERMKEKRGFITFDQSSVEDAKEAKVTAVAVCRALRVGLESNDSAKTAEALIGALISVRNARIHATLPKPDTRHLGTSADSVRRLRHTSETHKSDDHSDYEINVTAVMLLSIGKILLSAKTKRNRDDVEDIIRSRMRQMMDEIYERVSRWTWTLE